MECVIISGLSGAGKSKAASFLEDMGFFCVDNLPAPLIGKFAELGMAGAGEYRRVALVSDVRGGTSFSALFLALDELEEMGCPYTILFMDANDEAIVRRYKETRRAHPLREETDNLAEAIALERQMLEPLRERAHQVIDTSDLSTGRLRGELMRLFGPDSAGGQELEVRLSSFGFKHGLPMDADLVLDVRFLPNPYYNPHLRPLTGLDSGVRDYVFASPDADDFVARLLELLNWLLPKYGEEGRANLSVAIGCTGGRHRSVAVARAVAEGLSKDGRTVLESHRDMGRL